MLGLVWLAGSARAELYRWTDREGVTHYTLDHDRIPRRYRSEAEVVRSDGPIQETGGPLSDLGARREVDVAPAIDPAPAGMPTRESFPTPSSPPGPGASSVSDPAPSGGAWPAAAATGAASPVPDALPPALSSDPVLAAPVTLAGRQVPAAEPASAPAPPPPAPPRAVEPAPRVLDPDDPRTADILELEREIAEKQELIRELISSGAWEGGEFAHDARVRELAEVLPRLQAELDSLQGELGP